MSIVYNQSWRLADILLVDLRECIGATGGMNAEKVHAVELDGNVPKRIGASYVSFCFYPPSYSKYPPVKRSLAFRPDLVRFPLDAGLLHRTDASESALNIVALNTFFVHQSALVLSLDSPLEDIEIITAFGERSLWTFVDENKLDKRSVAFSYDAALSFRFENGTVVSIGPALKGVRGIAGDYAILFREFQAEDFSHLGDRIERRSIKQTKTQIPRH